MKKMLMIKLLDKMSNHVEDMRSMEKQANKWLHKGLYPSSQIFEAVAEINAMLNSHDYESLDSVNKLKLVEDYKKELK